MPPLAWIARSCTLAAALWLAMPVDAMAADVAAIQSLVDQGKLPEALKAVDAELKRDANNVNLRFLKGLVLARMDRLDQSAAIFEQLTREHPELPEPYNNLAVVYAAKGDFEKARDALQRAINTHPAYATAHENLGDIYAKMASQAYNHALELDRDNRSAKAKLALVSDLFSLPATPPVQVVQAAPTPAPAAAEPAKPEPTVAAAPAQPAPQETLPASAAATAPAAEPPASAPTVAASPAPAATAAGSKAAEDAVRRTLDLWASAWAAQDVQAYTGFYAPDFTPDDGQTRAQWVQSREARLKSPSYIRVDVTNLKVTMLGADHARADFMQHYQSNTYSDQVAKTLLFKKSGEHWLITLETAH